MHTLLMLRSCFRTSILQASLMLPFVLDPSEIGPADLVVHHGEKFIPSLGLNALGPRILLILSWLKVFGVFGPCA